MGSLLVRFARGTYVLVFRPLVRRAPLRLRRFLVRELAVDSPPTSQSGSVLPVLPTTLEDELYLGYLKGFLVDRQRECRGSDR